MKLNKCLCCGEPVNPLLDWGKMPLANNYNVKESYPLKLNKCGNCFHLQLDESVDPDIMFKDYPYMSGTSQIALDYFKEFSDIAMRYHPTAKTVLDIACNDGTQLDFFKDKGLTTYGIDPALNLEPIASKKGHIIKCEMFPTKTPIIKEVDIIVAQNVVAHVPDPLTFLRGCKDIMNDDSQLFIATSQANMISNTEFDTIYHEHISYFNTNSMKELLIRAGLTLVDVFTNPIHGTSYIFVVKKFSKPEPVQSRIDMETKGGLYYEKTYDKWVSDCNTKATKTRERIEQYRKDGYYIVGCGAAAKGITFLNLSKTQMDMIIDTTPTKWYNQVCNTTIYPFESIRNLPAEKVLFVVLAWNFKSEIVENIQKMRNNKSDKFITTND